MQPVALIDHLDPPPPARGEVRDQLHRRYFAEAGAAAARFGITFARLVRHLEEQSAIGGPCEPSNVRYLDDLLHVIACIDDDGRAWAELQERYDQFLIRRCAHRGGQIEAALAVGQLFAELRHLTMLAADDEPLSLWAYGGATPLRSWLADRLGRIRSASPHATVILPAHGRRQGAEPTCRVRTTRINLAQPIVAASYSRTFAGGFRPGAACPSAATCFRIGPAPAAERGAG